MKKSDNPVYMGLVDAAARGDIEAAAKLGEGFLKGSFDGVKNPEKARKWLSYAAKRGNELAASLLKQMDQKN